MIDDYWLIEKYCLNLFKLNFKINSIAVLCKQAVQLRKKSERERERAINSSISITSHVCRPWQQSRSQVSHSSHNGIDMKKWPMNNESAQRVLTSVAWHGGPFERRALWVARILRAAALAARHAARERHTGTAAGVDVAAGATNAAAALLDEALECRHRHPACKVHRALLSRAYASLRPGRRLLCARGGKRCSRR